MFWYAERPIMHYMGNFDSPSSNSAGKPTLAYCLHITYDGGNQAMGVNKPCNETKNGMHF